MSTQQSESLTMLWLQAPQHAAFWGSGMYHWCPERCESIQAALNLYGIGLRRRPPVQ